MSEAKKRYAFGTIAGRESPKGSSINAVYFPDQQELKDYRSSVKELNDWARQDTFALVEYSHHQFHLAVDSIQREFVKSNNPPHSKSFLLSLNAAFLNYLGMMRLYLDHTEFKLKRSETIDLSEFGNFQTATAFQYDNVFAYRFCYKLRNYAQHCGFPIGGLHASSQMVNRNPENIERSLNIMFKSNELLKNYDSWKQPLRTELQSLPAEFPVLQIADELLVALQNIHDTVMKGCLPRLQSAANIVTTLVEKSSQPGVVGVPHLIGLPANEEDYKQTALNLVLQPVPLELIDIVKELTNNLDGAQKNG